MQFFKKQNSFTFHSSNPLPGQVWKDYRPLIGISCRIWQNLKCEKPVIRRITLKYEKHRAIRLIKVNINAIIAKSIEIKIIRSIEHI